MAKLIKIIIDKDNSFPQRQDEVLSESSKLKYFSACKDDCLQIDKESLVPNTSICFNLFRQDGMNIGIVAKANANNPFIITDDFLSKVSNPRCAVLIERSAIPVYKDYLNSVANAPSLSDKERFERNTIVFKENTKILMKELLENPRSGEKIKQAKKAVDTIIGLLIDNKDALRKMLTLSRYDYYTYTHCLNVATLSIGLGLELRLSKNETGDLGIGAMMHDIGKSQIPAEILNKQGRLDELEYKRIQEHVKIGEDILRSSEEFPAEALPAVLQHHEKLSGNGYPYALRGDNIKLFGRICAVADCYDALTTERAYKKAFIPYEALTIIARETAHFDVHILKTFVKMLGNIHE